MHDENITQETQETQEAEGMQNEPVTDALDAPQDTAPDTTEKSTASEQKETFIDKWKNKIWGGGQTEQETETDTEVEEDIDDSFVETARSLGWTDEQIIELANDLTNDELREMVGPLAEYLKESPDDQLAKEKETSESAVEKTDAAIEERLHSLEKKLKAVETEKQVKERDNNISMANAIFDKASEDFPIFGKTDELLKFPAGTTHAGQLVPTTPQFKARSEVWKTACAFANLGINFNKAMEEALAWYKGKHLEEDVQNKLIKDLKKNETRLSAKRTAADTTKVYNNEVEEKRDVVLEAARKAGIIM